MHATRSNGIGPARTYTTGCVCAWIACGLGARAVSTGIVPGADAHARGGAVPRRIIPPEYWIDVKLNDMAALLHTTESDSDRS